MKGFCVLALLALAPASPASANHVGCGDVLRASTTLDSDLLDCPGNGVQLIGDGITFDLGGHLIDGTGQGLGVVSSSGSENVVTGGRLTGFIHAITFNGGSGSVVRDIELNDNHDGILLSSGDGVLVERVLATENDGSAVNAPFARHVVVRDNVFVGNAAGVSAFGQTESRYEDNLVAGSVFHGIRLAAVSDVVVSDNRLPGNGFIGIRLEEGSAGNLLHGNRVSETTGDGISLADDSGANRLERNRSMRNEGDGFDIAGPGAALVQNRADRNVGLGFDAPLGVALDRHNHARHNGDARQCVGVRC